MNALNLARTAYSSAAAPIRTQKSSEFEIFAKTTGRIRAAVERGKFGFADLASALHENRRLWALLAENVADPDNALPKQLRAQIVYLAEFSILHTAKVLEGTETADVLIDINTSIMRGLRQQGAVE